MSLNTANKIFLCVGLIDLVGLFVWLGVALHLAYTKMDIMLIHLKNSPAVTIRVPFKSGGPWGEIIFTWRNNERRNYTWDLSARRRGKH